MPSLSVSYLLSRQEAKLRVYVLCELILCSGNVKSQDCRGATLGSMLAQMCEHGILYRPANYATAHQPGIDLEDLASLKGNHQGDEAVVGETIT